jgi:isopenicillin-N epimerase
LVELVGQEPIVPDSREWYGSMAHVPLPPGDAASLQQALWSEHRIEVPIVAWNHRRWIRVSCHLYNTPEEIEQLVAALRLLL